MPNGIVKWWNPSKGYGFIERENGTDVFLHYSGIKITGFKTFEGGERVRFVVEQRKNGPAAIDVTLISEQTDNPSDINENDTKDIENELIAFALFGNTIKLVSFAKDGSYKLIDENNNLHNIFYVASNETVAFEVAIEELEHLINDKNSKEKDFQNFFERYPDFITNDEYKQAHSHIVLTNDNDDSLIPDFVLEPYDTNPLCDLLELKLPSTSIFVMKKNRFRFSASVFEACAQLREYSSFFDEENNRKKIHNKCGLLAYKPKMFVIIGRRGNVNPYQLRKMETDIPNFQILTYDDVINRAKRKVDAMKKRNSSKTVDILTKFQQSK